MKFHIEDSIKARNRSAVQEDSQTHHLDSSRIQFTDSRLGTATQQKLQRAAKDSPQAKQLKALKAGITDTTQAPVQRTGKDAYNYLKSLYPNYDTMGPKNILAKSLPFYLSDPRSPLKQNEKVEFLRQYNLNLPGDQQVKMEAFVDVQPQPQDAPKNELTEEQELDKIWTPGGFGKGSLNAHWHYQKHVLGQHEFNGQFGSALYYARAAKAFWRESGGISATQGRKGLAVKFDPRSGKYTLSVEDGGLIATFFEVQKIGGRDAPIDQIVQLTGMDKRTIEELLGRLHVEKKDNGPQRPQHDDDPQGGYGSMEDLDELVEVDGRWMSKWDAYDYWEHKRGVDY